MTSEKCLECGALKGMWHSYECSIGGRKKATDMRTEYEKEHGPIMDEKIFILDGGLGYSTDKLTAPKD